MKFDPPRRAVFLAGFTAFIDLYAPQSVLGALSAEFQVTPADAGKIIGISTFAVAVAAPFAGMIADKFGQRRVMMAALCILVPVTALLAAAHGLMPMLVLRFLQGLLLPAIFSTAIAFTADFWGPVEAADVTGLYVLGSVLGGFSGRFFTAVAADHFGWRGGFLVLTLVTALAAFGIWKWLPRRPRRTGIRPPGLGAFLDHLRNPPLLATYAVGGAMLFGNVATFTYIDFRLEHAPFNLSPTALGAVFVVYLIGAIATPVSGSFIRWLGRRGALAVATGFGVLGIVGTLFDWLPAIIAGLAFFVTGVFIAQTCALGFIGITARHNKTTAVGLYVCLYYIGGSVGALLPGIIWDSTGWPGCVGLVAFTTTVATLLAMWAWRTRIVVIEPKVT